MIIDRYFAARINLAMSLTQVGTKIVDSGTLEELEAHIKDNPLDTPEVEQKKINRLLVRALIAGRKDMFDYLVTPKEGSEKPLAEISSITNTNINNPRNDYLNQNDFNVGDDPFRNIKDEAEKSVRIKGAHEILYGIKNGQYKVNPKEVNLPAMAAYFGHVTLMEQMIREADRDFNQPIGFRNITALSTCIALDSSQENINHDMAMMMLTNASSIRLDITKQPQLCISCIYGAGNLEKTLDYLNTIGDTVLPEEELKALISLTYTALINTTSIGGIAAQDKREVINEKAIAELCDEKAGIMCEIAAKIANNLSQIHVDSASEIMNQISRQANTYITDSELSLDRSRLLMTSYLKMLPNNEQHRDYSASIVKEVQALFTAKQAAIETIPTTPDSGRNSSMGGTPSRQSFFQRMLTNRNKSSSSLVQTGTPALDRDIAAQPVSPTDSAFSSGRSSTGSSSSPAPDDLELPASPTSFVSRWRRNSEDTLPKAPFSPKEQEGKTFFKRITQVFKSSPDNTEKSAEPTTPVRK